MEFKSYQDALAYIEGKVPGATPEQIEAAKAWLDSPEGKAATQKANTPTPLSKSKSTPIPNATGGALQSAQFAQNKASTTGLQDAADKSVADMKAEEEERVKKAYSNKKADMEGSVIQNVMAREEQDKQEGGLNDAVANTTDLEKSDIEKDLTTQDVSKGTVNPANTEEVSETIQEAEEASQPEPTDTPEERQIKNKYKNQTMTIWDAYYNGEFGEPGSKEAKNTRNYFIIDAIAKFASNTGRSIGNVGAQYSGGTIDQGHDVSKFEEIRDTLGSEELQSAKEQLGGQAGRKAESEILSNESQALANARAEIINKYTPAQVEAQTKMLQKELEMAGINISLANSKMAVINYIKQKPDWESNPYYVYLVSSLAQSGVGGTAQSTANVLSSVIDIFK